MLFNNSPLFLLICFLFISPVQLFCFQQPADDSGKGTKRPAASSPPQPPPSTGDRPPISLSRSKRPRSSGSTMTISPAEQAVIDRLREVQSLNLSTERVYVQLHVSINRNVILFVYVVFDT
jgi:hypothetical protein